MEPAWNRKGEPRLPHTMLGTVNSFVLALGQNPPQPFLSIVETRCVCAVYGIFESALFGLCPFHSIHNWGSVHRVDYRSSCSAVRKGGRFDDKPKQRSFQTVGRRVVSCLVLLLCASLRVECVSISGCFAVRCAMCDKWLFSRRYRFKLDLFVARSYDKYLVNLCLFVMRYCVCCLPRKLRGTPSRLFVLCVYAKTLQVPNSIDPGLVAVFHTCSMFWLSFFLFVVVLN